MQNDEQSASFSVAGEIGRRNGESKLPALDTYRPVLPTRDRLQGSTSLRSRLFRLWLLRLGDPELYTPRQTLQAPNPKPLKHMGVDQNYGPFWGVYYSIFLIVSGGKRGHNFDQPPHPKITRLQTIVFIFGGFALIFHGFLIWILLFWGL